MICMERHTFSDRDICKAETWNGRLEIVLDNKNKHIESIVFNREDVIEMAKEFGLHVYDGKSKL